jgi:CheY-like chemotaxis protein
VTPKLLLADDSVTIQRVIELTFADEDVEVLAVGDGQQAIDRVQAERPDIVLADVGMPERDGYEVTAFIKGNPQLAHIPVLLLTGAFEPIDEARAKAVGCDGVLVKPFEPQMVISRVRDLLAGNRTEEQSKRPAPGPAPVPHHVKSEQAEPASGAEPGSGSLEEYFDRLDAALASKMAPAFAATVPASPPLVVSPRQAPAASAAQEERRVADPVRPRETSPQPAAATNVWQPPALQDAFAALLAAEQGQAIAPVAPRLDSPSNELIDEIARRVIARMGDDSMRTAVLDAAERLVREEIERIKSAH